MRYPKDHKLQTRERIVAEAARRFRCEGIDAVGVASLMDSAGLTHGGFYAHFPSKDALVAEVCRGRFDKRLPALQAAVDAAPAGAKLQELSERYLSVLHRDHPGQGCFAATLAAETARKPGPVQDAMTERIGDLLALIQSCTEADGSSAPAPAIAAILVGALTLARTVNHAELSAQFLAEGRRAVAELAAAHHPAEGI